MRRPPSSDVIYQFGPGPWTPAVRAIIIANVAVYLATMAWPEAFVSLLGLTPEQVITGGRVWQLATYAFVHDPHVFAHILFNLLYVWMFGVDLERRWGSAGFAKYYAVTAIGAAVTIVVVSLLPFDAARANYAVPTIGASGAVYGLLLAWALAFPHRTVLFMMVIPVRAWAFALIMAAIVFISAAGSGSRGVSHLAHAGGLIVGYLFLRGPGGLSGGPRRLRLEFQYRLARWRMARLRRKFEVVEGGKRGSGTLHSIRLKGA